MSEPELVSGARGGAGPRLALAGVLALTVLVYWIGLDGPLVLDDFDNIVNQPKLALATLDAASLREALFASGRELPWRGLALLTFALNHYFSGAQFDPFALKLTNLVIHLANGVLVFALARALLRRVDGAAAGAARAEWTAVLVAALWVLHPIQLTAVLYVVQRMASLAATCVFLGLLAFVHGRSLVAAGRGRGFAWMLGGVAGGLALGYLCKQNAVLLPFLALVVEIWFFDRTRLAPAHRRWLATVYLLGIGVPALGGLVGLVVGWDFVAETYLHRTFGPLERLLTEARVLWFYLGLMAWPEVTRFGLHHDGVVVSAGLLEPLTTLPALVAWVVLLGLACARRRAMWGFAIVWYLVAHALESSIIGLELAFEHRNYVPSFGVLLAAGYYLGHGWRRLGASPRLASTLLVVLVATIAASTAARAHVWSDRQTLVRALVENHPGSSRAHADYALVLARGAGTPQSVFHHWRRAAELDPGEVLALVEMAKLLQGYIIAGGGGAAAPPGAVDLFSAELRPEVEHLQALYAGVVSEVTRRLVTYPVESSTGHAMLGLRRCVSAALAPCTAMRPHLGPWLELIVENPRVRAEDRAVMLLQLARQRFAEGRGDEALALVQRAIESRPDDVLPLFDLANLQLARRDVDGAASTIATIETYAGPRGVRSREIEALRVRLTGLRTGAPAPPGPRVPDGD